MSQLNDLIGKAQPEQLEKLRTAPETQKIFEMLNLQTGGKLEKSAEDAANGDTAQLMDAIKRLMQDPQGAKLIQQIKSKMNPQ